MEIRSGQFGVFGNEQFELIKKADSLCRLVIRKDEITDKQEILGFKNYDKSIYIVDLKCNDIDSAFYVNTYCIYKGFKFQATNILSNGYIRIWHSIEAQKHFKDYARHGYDPHVEVNEIELEEIWEERTPIEGFDFDVDSVFYIKRR